MEKPKISNSFYYLLAIGISLSSVSIKIPVSISLTDITILMLLFYAIILHQRVILNLMTLWVLLFAIEIFIANMINYYLQSEFSLAGFLSNYLRIIAIVMVVIFTPSLMKEFDFKKFSQAILLILKIHCILVIFDPFVVYPWTFFSGGISLDTSFQDPDLANRGRGLFAEPSFFAGYVGLMSSLILQYQANSKEVIFRYWDILIIFLGLIASASLTGISVGALILFQMLIIQRRDIFKINSLLKSLAVLALAIPILTLLLAGSAIFITERLSGGLAGGSTMARLVGSTIFTGNVLRERPLIGIGLGNENHNIFIQKQDTGVLFDAIQTPLGEGFLLEETAVTFWASLSAGGGIPLLLIFYILVLGSLVFNKKTFYVGVMIFFLGISRGGVFDISLWWVIATSLALRFVSETNRRALTKQNNE